jgi:hypothetical protein
VIEPDTATRMRRTMTERAFLHPVAGDAFEEMLSFWVIVIDVGDDGQVSVVEFGGPGELPADARTVRVFASGDVFRSAYAYGRIPGYSVQWAKTIDVDGWVEYLREQGRLP